MSSDRRQLLNEILQCYYPEELKATTVEQEVVPADKKPDELEAATAEKDDSNQGSSNKAAVDAHAQLVVDLLPDPIETLKFQTHVEKGELYLFRGQPLWIRIDNNRLIPTVYTLWKRPSILPSIYTWAPVASKLMEGADLMLPGVIVPSEGFSNVKQGDFVTILTWKTNVPVAVGEMAVDLNGQNKPNHGKAVHIIHVYKDYLWAHGDKSHPPKLSEDESSDTTEQSTESKTESEQVSPQLTPAEVDDILKRSVYQALTEMLITTEKLPMPITTFYSNYILVCQPRGQNVDIKQSSWKKVAKFMKVLEKAKLLKLKDMNGQSYLQSVDWKHPTLVNFAPHKTESQAGGSSSSGGAKNSDNIVVKNVWKATGSTVLFFEKIKLSTKELYKSSEITKIINDYVNANDLVDCRNKKMINLDPNLTMVLLTKDERDKVTQVPRSELTNRLCQFMTQFHVIEVPGQDPIISKNAFSPVEIIVESRMGNKIVTRILGLETFSVNLKEIAKRLQIDCAGSVAVDPIEGKKGFHEVMVQGSHVDRVMKILIDYGISKKFIESIDKTKKKKKK
ncbi:hypothetical protein BDF19DRAFT_467372 [Syncephalis fuscata]|nr:hypothetical protein BDF19DRAFT_467372 [Syncephalis fuscata]